MIESKDAMVSVLGFTGVPGRMRIGRRQRAVVVSASARTKRGSKYVSLLHPKSDPPCVREIEQRVCIESDEARLVPRLEAGDLSAGKDGERRGLTPHPQYFEVGENTQRREIARLWDRGLAIVVT